MFLEFLTSVVSDSLQIPLWTIVLATGIIVWLLWKPTTQPGNTTQVNSGCLFC